MASTTLVLSMRKAFGSSLRISVPYMKLSEHTITLVVATTDRFVTEYGLRDHRPEISASWTNRFSSLVPQVRARNSAPYRCEDRAVVGGTLSGRVMLAAAPGPTRHSPGCVPGLRPRVTHGANLEARSSRVKVTRPPATSSRRAIKPTAARPLRPRSRALCRVTTASLSSTERIPLTCSFRWAARGSNPAPWD